MSSSAPPSGIARSRSGGSASTAHRRFASLRRSKSAPPLLAYCAPLIALSAGIASAGLAPSPVVQSSHGYAGAETGIPWIGLVGWNISLVAGATQFASTNVTGPSLALQTKHFVLVGPINTNSTYLWVTLEIAPGAPVAQEFTMYVAVNGTDSIAPFRLPGLSAEHFFQTQNTTFTPANLTLAFNVGGKTAVVDIRSVTLVVAVCPKVGTCP